MAFEVFLDDEDYGRSTTVISESRAKTKLILIARAQTICPFKDRQRPPPCDIANATISALLEQVATSTLGRQMQRKVRDYMKRLPILPLLLAVTSLGALSPVGSAQSADVPNPSSNAVSPPVSAPVPTIDFIYKRPTEKTKLHHYFYDAFGPYAIASGAILGGIDQADKAPPEWGQGAAAYGERVGSDFGIALVTTTTRYALAEALQEDTLYYRCECTGAFRRLNHALISTVTARHGSDGHRRLSLSAIVSPYVGAMTAVYGWYPNRYGARDALRMGNYTLLAFAGINIAREFIYGGPHTLFGHRNRPTAP